MSEPKLVKAGSEVRSRIGNPTNFLTQTGGDVKPNVGSTADQVDENGGSTVPPNPAIKRPNGSGRPFDGPSSSPKRGRPASNSQTVVIPISALNPFQNRWVVKGRVVSKSGTRTWHNQRGDGKLFSFDLKDDTGDVRITAFNQECERFQSIVEVGKVLRVSRGQVKNANKRFTQSDYEVTLNADSTVEEDDDGMKILLKQFFVNVFFSDNDCPQVEYKFVKISEIESMEPNTLVDVAGVIRKVEDATTIMQKTTQKELIKRDLSLVDESDAEIKLTMWGLDAQNFNALPGSVLFARNARVSDYNGKSLNGGSVQVDPNHENCQRLIGITKAFSVTPQSKLNLYFLNRVVQINPRKFEAEIIVWCLHVWKRPALVTLPGTERCVAAKKQPKCKT